MPSRPKDANFYIMQKIVNDTQNRDHDEYLRNVLSMQNLSKKTKEQLGDVYDRCTTPPLGSFAD